MKHTYILQGPPIPLLRNRISYLARRSYDSQKELKRYMAIELAHQHGNLPLFKGPLKFSVIYYMPLPESWSHKKINLYDGRMHTSRPDTDNLIKMNLDVAQSILFDDDSLICIIEATKIYDANARTEFTLEELKP